jgi:plastocyanin
VAGKRAERISRRRRDFRLVRVLILRDGAPIKEGHMRLSKLAPVGVFASILGLSACGSGYKAPTDPSPAPAPPPSNSTAITIVGDRGSQSFTPNPGPASGGMVSWRNTDGVLHHIKSNDGTFDSGDIGPGQTSAPRAVPATGMNYHCTIHPGMVGAINAEAGPPPPCTGVYCASAPAGAAAN